jgi:outer membrane protein TolC
MTLYSDVTNQNIYRDPTGITDRFPVLTTVTSPVLDLFTPERLFLTSTAVVQPVTQILKIYRADRVALAEKHIAQNDVKAAQREVVFGVHRLYFGILIAQKQKVAAQASVQAAQETLQDAQNAYQSGNVLEVSVIGSRAQLLQSRQALLVARIQESDLVAEMNNVLGFPLDTELILEEAPLQNEKLISRDEYLKGALMHNPDILNVKETITKAKHGVEAAYCSYIPDISLFARYTYQDTIPWIERNTGSYGVMMTWNLFDWGKRHAVIGQRKEQLEQARLNQERVEKRLSVDVEKAYRKLEQTRMLMDAAR